MDQTLALQTKDLLDSLWMAGVVLFLIILFKDVVSGLADDVLLYIKISLDKKIISSEGGIVFFGKDAYVIEKIGLSYIHFRKKGNGRKIRMTLKKYWNGTIEYESADTL